MVGTQPVGLVWAPEPLALRNPRMQPMAGVGVVLRSATARSACCNLGLCAGRREDPQLMRISLGLRSYDSEIPNGK